MSETASTRLGQALTQDSVRAVNFFNGRLLTAGDLSRDQDARRLADARVGAAMGSGIAWGLEVHPAASGVAGEVDVASGLAISLSGRALHVATSVTLTLVQPPIDAPDTSGSTRDFGPCRTAGGSGSGSYVVGDGLFLLVLSPIDQPDGFAPVLALEAINTRCAQDLVLEASQLRLIRLPQDALNNVTGSGANDIARLRNRMAYDCFGAQDRRLQHREPHLGANRAASTAQHGAGLGLLDRLLTDRVLSRCDVPLALIYMIGRQVAFLDTAAVRRRVAAQPATHAWSAWLGERLQSQAEAQMLQFQSHCADTPAILQQPATQALDWLPPAGVLPGATDWARFFGARRPARLVPLSEADAPAVLQQALLDDPISLASGSDVTRVRVYRIGGGPDGHGSGPLLFVRDARNVRHAEQVWLDGERAGLPALRDVQSAIDRLRQGSCLHVVIHATMSVEEIHERFAQLKGSERVSISFEPARHSLKKPLVLQQAGHVEIHGHQSVLQDTQSGRVLVIRGCDSLLIRGLELRGDAARGLPRDPIDKLDKLDKLDKAIGGHGAALTVLDTPVVRIEGLRANVPGSEEARAAAETQVARAGISVSMDARSQVKLSNAMMRVDIGHCELHVGNEQLGILCLNADQAHVHDNLIQADDKAGPMQQGIVVAGGLAGQVHIERNEVLGAVAGIAVAVSDEAGKDDPALSAERVHLAHNRVRVELTESHRVSNRFGLMVGNAQAVELFHNQVQAAGKVAQELGLHGIRLHGLFGSHLVARDNHVDGAAVGVRFDPIKLPRKKPLWLFAGNLGENLAGKLIDTTSEAAQLITECDNLDL